MLKPIKCCYCQERVLNLSSMDKRVLISNTNFRITMPNVLLSKRITPAELHNELKKKGK